MEVATLRGGESERRPLTLLVAIMMLLDVVAKERQKREKERKKKRKQEEVGRAGREADERAGGRAIAHLMHSYRLMCNASRQVLFCFNLRRRRPSGGVLGVPAATSTPHELVQ